MGLLTGKTILIMGVANKRSIAWGIAQSCYREDAELLFTYQTDREKEHIEELLSDNMSGAGFPLVQCDVSTDEGVATAFAEIRKHTDVLHGLAHCIAFAKREELQGEYVNTSRDGYLLAQNISAYSLVAVSHGARPLMTEGGSIVTLTYLGGERVVENYNVMGVAKAALDANVRYLANDLGPEDIRVNAISAGPVRTVSAKGVGDFSKVQKVMEERSPLRRPTNQEEIGDAAAFLLSSLGRGVTGEVLHVDGGFHVLGF